MLFALERKSILSKLASKALILEKPWWRCNRIRGSPAFLGGKQPLKFNSWAGNGNVIASLRGLITF